VDTKILLKRVQAIHGLFGGGGSYISPPSPYCRAPEDAGV